MNAIKQNVKRFMPVLLRSMYSEKRYIGIIKKYLKGSRNIKKLRKLEKKQFPVIVLIVTFPEVWNSISTVYEAFVAKGISPQIICVPKPAVTYSHEYIPSKENEAYQFFGARNISAVNAYNPVTGNWIDLQSFRPDYVIYTRPYNEQYPDLYRTTCVCSYARTCYIPYAYSQTCGGLLNATFNHGFMLAVYLTFAPSEIRLKECREKFALQVWMKSHKYVFKGFPRFDLLKFEESDMVKKGRKKTILWLPRWTVNAPEGKKKSSFFIYLDKFFTFMEKNPQIELIIRPHPLMFKVVLEKKILKEEEVTVIKKRVSETINIRFDENKDYLVAFRNSDILVSDFSSLLIEYFVSGKPIIYCDTAEDFNEDAMLMDSVLYHASEWHEVEEQLKKLEKGEDPLYEKRKEVIRQLMPSNAGEIGKEIADYLLADFEAAKHKG